jgi:hypothetical protein
MYGSEYLFSMRKEITTNYKIKKKADKYDKHHKIRKNNIMFLLRHYLIHLYNIFPPHILWLSAV